LAPALALASAAAQPQLPLDEPSFVAVGNAESIPDGVVSSLAEDASGMIWIGSPAGLIRYDGYRFRFHIHERDDPGSISGNFIRSLLVTRDGRVWAGTEADGLSVYDPRDERFTSFRHDPAVSAGIGIGAVTALAEDQDGALWVGQRGGGLRRLDPGSGLFRHFPLRAGGAASVDEDRAQALLVDRDGTLWVGTWSGLLRRRPGETEFEPVASDPARGGVLVGKTIWCLFQARDGRIWVGAQQGDLVLVDPGSGEVVPIPQSANEGDIGATIYAAVQPNESEVWIGRASGIDVRDAGHGRLLRRVRHDPARAASLASNEVRALFLDRAHLVWVGGYGGGVQRHDPSHRSLRVRRHDPGHGGVFRDPNVRSLLELADGRILAGTQENGVAIFDRSLRLIDGFAPDPANPNALKGGRVGGLAESTSGELWIGTDSGLYRLDPRTRSFEKFATGKGRTRKLFAGRDGEIWIATEDGLFRKSPQAAEVTRLLLANGTALAGDVNALEQSGDGRVWVGTENGIYTTAADESVLQPLRVVSDRDLVHSTVLGLLFDRLGQLWVDTPEGLHLMQREADGRAAFVRISEQLGIARRPFGANLLEDGQGRLWTHEFVYDPVYGRVNELTRADGVDFGTGWFRAYAKTRDGRLLFGGSKGLLVVEPDGYAPWSYAPPLVVSELRVDGRARAVGTLAAGLELAAEERGFSIEFAALDLSAPERNRYSFLLEGWDPEWNATDASYRVATYSNLWPGRYTMRVRGSNRNGIISPHELRIPVRVLPRFWQTWWFAALVLTLFIGLVSLGTRLRTARIRRKALELQQLVDGRTAELRAAKERAELALEELQGAQRQLVEAEKMASLGGLVAGIAHEINTPIGIAVTAATHLQESSRQLVSRFEAKELKASDLPQFRDTVNESMRLVLGSLERALQLITSFKKVAVDQSSEQRRRFDLRGFLEDVCTALQPSYKHTLHRLEVDCPAGIEVDTYPGALFQILTNLITNSLLHAFAEEQGGLMRISADREGDLLVLRYRDDGRGMTDAVAAHAFDPFFTTRRGSGGSGLGLHVVFNLVTQMLAGRIELITAPGRGCEFVMRIPVRAPERSVR
jgi:ligand-binding sensor domain-containing protein/signal transduction histidine kinase